TKVLRPQSTHQIEPGHTGHAVVCDNYVKRFGGNSDLYERFPAIPRPGYLTCRTSEYHRSHVPDGFFILNNQDPRRFAHNSRCLRSKRRAEGSPASSKGKTPNAEPRKRLRLTR